MPLFKVEIFKRLGAEEWCNRYYILSSSLSAAVPISSGLTAAEVTFHSNQVLFTYTRTSTAEEGDTQFHNEPHNTYGALPTSTTGGLLPLWNVVKAYLTKGFQRPDYKLYRGVLGEANSESGSVASATMALIDTALTNAVSAEPPYLADASGDLILNINVDPLIRQRDLHRRKRSTTAPALVVPS